MTRHVSIDLEKTGNNNLPAPLRLDEKSGRIVRRFDPTIEIRTRGALLEVFDAIRLRYRQWCQYRENRAAFDNMLELDDQALKDIGTSRDDVIWASKLPLSVNAALELEKLKLGARK